MVYFVQARYAAAEPVYRRTLAILDKNPILQAQQIAAVGIELAELYRVQGRNMEAETLYERVIATEDKTPGPEHLEVGPSLFALADLYRQEGRYDKAEPLYRRALAILEEQPARSPGLANGLKSFASMLRHMKRKTEAVALEARAKAILRGQQQVQAFIATNPH